VDLVGVSTFGFRGEALPSIAAVSRLVLETAEAGEEAGTALRVEGGTILSVQEFPRRPGTTVEVRNLFFNAPARRRFLKAAGAEARAVSEAVVALALANPAISFSLASGNRRLLDLPATEDVASRVSVLWGHQEAATLFPVMGGEGEMTVRGLIQRPDAAEAGFRRAYLFVNGRPFKAPALLRAADRGYLTTLHKGQRPWLFLYFQVRGGAVDVNVHPAKLEVRFRDPASVDALVETVVREALAGEASAATLDTQLSAPRLDRPPTAPLQVREPRQVSESQTALFLSGLSPQTDGLPGGTQAEETAAGPPPGVAESARPRLWQVHDTYILAETRDGLLVIDQHSAHERVLFQRLMGAFEETGMEGQRLLFPVTIRLTPAELKQVTELKGIFSRAGFEVEEFGGDMVILQAMPNPHPYFDGERCFREMVAELTEGSELTRAAKNQHERIAMTFACKGAIKAGQALSAEEMAELFDALFATELPHHDVHGRPTIVRLGKGELERKFGRHG
jgi:DNA mismatch repair protein MutL